MFRFASAISNKGSNLLKFSTNATVAAKTVRLTFVDEEGHRVSLPGRVGQTLQDVAKMHNIDINGSCHSWAPLEIKRTDKWTETTYGEGAACFQCHVKISSEYDDILPKLTKYDIDEFEDVWEEEVTKSSRLACTIHLDERHDGMVVFVPDAAPVNII